jgi:hypothetical protein
MHAVGTVRVSVAAVALVASAASHWQFLGSTNATPVLLSAGRYDDELRCVDGTWKLARRVITVG